MRDRLLLPLLIPVGAAAAIFLLIFSTSRILIYALETETYSHDTGKYVATAIAIIGAVFILGVCTLLAQGPRLNPRAIYSFTALPASIIIAFGLWLAVRPHEGEGHATEPAAVVTSAIETATDNKFSQTAIAVPAGQEVTVTLENRGQALHNWRVKGVASADGKEIKTQLIGGGKTETLVFTIAAPGNYEFDCEVHPVEMKGTLTVQ
jgi:plastocyanin